MLPYLQATACVLPALWQISSQDFFSKFSMVKSFSVALRTYLFNFTGKKIVFELVGALQIHSEAKFSFESQCCNIFVIVSSLDFIFIVDRKETKDIIAFDALISLRYREKNQILFDISINGVPQ